VWWENGGLPPLILSWELRSGENVQVRATIPPEKYFPPPARYVTFLVTPPSMLRVSSAVVAG